VAVSDDDYISQWAGNRYRVYQVDPEDHRAGEGILAQLARSIDRWRKLLGDRGQHDVAECIGALSIALRAEEKGARLLWTAVRSEEEKAPLPCAIGPLGIRHFAMEDEVAAFVDRLRRRSESPANELLAQLMRFFDRDHAETLDDEKATVERLERMFSVLRHAAVLDDDGQLEAALEQLRKQQGNGVGRAEFGRCNPAFAIAGGSELLEGAARKFEIALLLRLGEQEVSSAEDRVDRGVAYWRAALALADGDASAATIASIHKIAVGRAHALDRRERVPEAIRLLDAVNDLCGDGTILGELATLHAHRAIMVANESKDWETAVDELRKARELNSRSQFIDRNFVIALRQRAHQIFEEQQADSYQLLREALAVAETLLRTDPDNSESQSFVAETRAELLFMFPGNMGRSVPIRRPMPGRGSGAGAREHRERGLLHARAGQYHAAAEELQSALRDDPGDAQARQELADVLMHMLSG
jgi:tetratricopeptide (TPR) repeat protein